LRCRLSTNAAVDKVGLVSKKRRIALLPEFANRSLSALYLALLAQSWACVVTVSSKIKRHLNFIAEFTNYSRKKATQKPFELLDILGRHCYIVGF
jgi:hypothetical protein